MKLIKTKLALNFHHTFLELILYKMKPEMSKKTYGRFNLHFKMIFCLQINFLENRRHTLWR